MMYFKLTQDRKSYLRTSSILSTSNEPITQKVDIPNEWKAFGRPIQYHGEPGMIGMTRYYWSEKEIRKIAVHPLFWPFRVLETLTFPNP